MTPPCESCTELMFDQPIISPADLAQSIRVIKQRFDEGVLVEAPVGNSRDTAFSSLPANGPWPDLIHSRLACASCGQAFILECETYHGAGGKWMPDA